MSVGERTVVYPGTFDPMTLGHFDLITRAVGLYDKVIVAVAATSVKKGAMFPFGERAAMIRADVEAAGFANVEIAPLDCLLVDFCKARGVRTVLRGVRVYSDFEYEFQMALTNKKLWPKLETIFMMPNENYAYVSSSTVREIAQYGGDTSSLVTPAVEAAIRKAAAARAEGGER